MSTGAPVGRSVTLLAWALAAVVAGFVVWSAVELIGGERGGASASVLSESEVASLATQAMPSGAADAASTHPGGTAWPDVPTTGSAAGAPVAASPSQPPPAPVATSAPLGASAGPAPDPAALAANAQAAAQAGAKATPGVAPGKAATASASGSSTTHGQPVVARTWPITGGQVGVSCTGARIELLFATPQDGWTVKVSQSGPESVEVAFRRGGSQSDLHAVCVNGTPTRESDSSWGDD